MVKSLEPLPLDADRIALNLEMAYEQWLDARREQLELPASIFWQRKAAAEYLSVKRYPGDPGTTIGRRSNETEALFDAFRARAIELKTQIESTNRLIHVRAGLYRALRLPSVPDSLGERLRAFDVDGRLGKGLLDVGHSMAAYSLICGVRFEVELSGAFTDEFVASGDPAVSELFLGTPVRIVVSTVARRACPLVVPDPIQMIDFLAIRPGSKLIGRALWQMLPDHMKRKARRTEGLSSNNE